VLQARREFRSWRVTCGFIPIGLRLLAVELCSLTIQQDDLSVANLISSGLFGDGAAAVIIAGAGRELPGPEIVATRSIFYPNTEEGVSGAISEKGFKIVLSPGVPDMVRNHLAQSVSLRVRNTWPEHCRAATRRFLCRAENIEDLDAA
jgi:predicted naringenin-chalcone synthase